MFDGWETARNINRPHVYECGEDGHLIIPGSENTVIQLGHAGIITKVDVEVKMFP
jgi:allantoicase